MTGMMMSFSPPGFPSPFSLRMEFASCELSATPRVAAAAVNPRAERAVPNRIANALRVEVKFIFRLLSIYDLEFVVGEKCKIVDSCCVRRHTVLSRECR